MFDLLLERTGPRPACRTMVEILALAHERACETELAALLADDLAAARIPDLAALRRRFAPDPAALPAVIVQLVPLAVYDTARLLAALAEHEIAERDRRRVERHLLEARLPPGKTIDAFAFDAVPMVSKAQVLALCAGDGWLHKGANLILFGPPGGGKSHLAAAIGFALVESGWRVLFTRTSEIVQKLQIARRELALDSAIAKCGAGQRCTAFTRQKRNVWVRRAGRNNSA